MHIVHVIKLRNNFQKKHKICQKMHNSKKPMHSFITQTCKYTENCYMYKETASNCSHYSNIYVKNLSV